MSFVRQYWFVLLTVVVAGAAYGAWETSLIPHHVEHCTYQYETYKKECAPHNTILVALIETREFIEKNEKIFTVLTTVFIAAFTGTLWWSTRRLWRATKNLADDAKITAESQSTDTRVLQRAYLAIAPGGVIPLSSTTPPYTVAHISVQNVGNLPARNVSWFIDCKLSLDGKLNDFPIDESLFYGKNIIPPGTEMKRSQTCNFDFEEVRDFQKSDLSFYVWGEVRYLDGFDTPRFSKFCHRYNKTGMGYGDVALGGGYVAGVPMLRADGMRFHQFGNDAD
jgi:hypothetical protein